MMCKGISVCINVCKKTIFFNQETRYRRDAKYTKKFFKAPTRRDLVYVRQYAGSVIFIPEFLKNDSNFEDTLIV